MWRIFTFKIQNDSGWRGGIKKKNKKKQVLLDLDHTSAHSVALRQHKSFSIFRRNAVFSAAAHIMLLIHSVCNNCSCDTDSPCCDCCFNRSCHWYDVWCNARIAVYPTTGVIVFSSYFVFRQHIVISFQKNSGSTLWAHIYAHCTLTPLYIDTMFKKDAPKE